MNYSSQSIRSLPARVAAVGVAMGLLAGCAADGDGDTATEDEGDSTVSFSHGMTTSAVTGAVFEQALMNANENYGYNGEWVELSNSETSVSGVSSNEFQFASGVTATAMLAQQAENAPMTFVADFVAMPWIVVAEDEIQACDDLTGERFALHSPGGVSTTLFNAWFEEQCPDVEPPEILYVEGSSNRLQGLQAEQFEATMLKLEDYINMSTDGFHIMANFAEDLENIEVNNIFANDEFLESHPEVVSNYLYEISSLITDINDDPTVLAAILEELRPELVETNDTADEIAEAYVDGGLLLEDGGMTQDKLEATIQLYEEGDAIDPGLTYDDVADRQYLEDALSAD